MLAVRSGSEAVRMMVRSHRLEGDFKEVIRNHEDRGPEAYPFHLSVREFVAFPVDFELRAFVYDCRLTALSQYNNFVLSPGINRFHEAMLTSAREFVEGEVIPRMSARPNPGMDSYVLDLALDPLPGGAGFKVYVVEVNPMAELAGAACFKWSQDKAVLLGLDAFEFRFNTQVPPFHGVNPAQQKFMEDVVEYGPAAAGTHRAWDKFRAAPRRAAAS